MAVDRDDLGRPCCLRPAHRRIDLLGIEAPPLLIHRRAPVHLLPRHDPAHAFHVGHDHHAHAPPPPLSAVESTKNTKVGLSVTPISRSAAPTRRSELLLPT